MIFSSTVFLFLFLPFVLLGHLVLPRPLRNPFLVFASLFFYAWGETGYVLIMLVSIGANYLLGLRIGRGPARSSRCAWLVLAVCVNLALLGWFKYAHFLVEALNRFFLLPLGHRGCSLEPVHLPIGISFFTFQALTYVVDVYRGDAKAQPRLGRVALYISLFPQLIAGPIVRYREIAGQLAQRVVTRAEFAQGVTRFIVGLGKKTLIANTLAVPADRVFGLAAGEISAPLAWWGLLCYSFQIYFDFSGYSDMAIGLGRMLGFRFPENFNYPYVSASLTEFWRRWHISLSSWFRDYLYIPLGGNRRGAARTGVNLVVVFFLCGLWHGASWTFVIWGLYHGAFLVMERLGLGRALQRRPAVIGHAYAMLVVTVGWVLFNSTTLAQAGAFLGAMAGRPAVAAVPLLARFLNVKVALALAVAAVGSAPTLPLIVERARGMVGVRAGRARPVVDGVLCGAGVAALMLVLFACASSLAAGTHNPFIYFRF